jgi:hypothetical protein
MAPDQQINQLLIQGRKITSRSWQLETKDGLMDGTGPALGAQGKKLLGNVDHIDTAQT